jgi:hypothetical protein
MAIFNNLSFLFQLVLPPLTLETDKHGKSLRITGNLRFNFLVFQGILGENEFACFSVES